MGTWKKLNKYGLQEYSFEIGPMDDSDQTVAIVGLEYSSVSEYDKFYSKEDVDPLIDGRDAEIRRQKYKRCYSLAKWCLMKFNYHYIVGRNEGGKLAKENFRLYHLYSKWYDRWMALADKFKERK